MSGRRAGAAALLFAAGAAACRAATSDPPPAAVLAASIAFFEDRLGRRPDDVLSPGVLADRYLMRYGLSRDIADVWRAESVLTRGLVAHPGHGPFVSRLTAVHIARHEFPEALAAARAAYAARPRRALNGPLFDAWFEVGRFDSALAALDRMDPHSFGYLIRKARFDEVQGRLDLARRALNRACRPAAAGEARLAAWCLVRQGDVELAAGSVDRAERLFRDALAAVPGDVAALTGLAEAARAAGRVAEAERWYRHAAQRPEGVAAELELARLAAARGDWAVASEHGRRFERRAGDPRFGRGFWAALAERYAETGDGERALALALADRMQRPGPETFGTLARVLYRLRRPDEARAMMDTALVWAPANPALLALRDTLAVRPSPR